MSPDKLNLLSFGAGALGTYVGGSLALKGHRVVFLERPEVAENLRQHGLRLRTQTGEQQIHQPHTAGSLQEALDKGPFDAAIFALKSYDTAAALEIMRPYAGELPPVLSLQNGVGNEPAIAAVLGTGKVIAGTVTSAIGRRAAGDVVLERLRGAGVAAGHVLSEVLVEAFNQAGLNARLYTRADDMKWSKMITNLLANATSAILNMTPGEIFSHPRLARLEIHQLREALQVMAAEDIQVVDLPGTPVRALALVVRRLPAGIARSLLKKSVGSGRGEKMPSFHIDLHSRRGKSEVSYLNGAVVQHGERSGVPTPVNRLLAETLLALTAGDIPMGQFDHRPEALLSRLDQWR